MGARHPAQELCAIHLGHAEVGADHLEGPIRRRSGTCELGFQIVLRPHVPLREAAPEAPDFVAAVVERLLAKDPAERYESTTAACEALARCKAELFHDTAAAGLV